MPQEEDLRSAEAEERARQTTEKLKAETDVSQDMGKATPEQQRNWRHQENDLRHVHGNSYTAGVQNEKDEARVNLAQGKVHEMSSQEKDAVMKELSKNLDSLSQGLQQSQTQKQDLKQEQ